MHTHRHLLAAAALVASFQAAHADPRQNDVLAPGGFVNACAAPSGGGTGWWAGDNFSPVSGNCDASYFSGAGTASSSASYNVAPISNQAAGSVKMGWVQMSAENHSLAASSFATGVVSGGYTDTLTINLSGHAGESAHLLVKVQVTAGMWAAGVAGASGVEVVPYLNKAMLSMANPGYDDGSSNHLWGTDRQVAAWGVGTDYSQLNASLNLNEVVTFSVPVIIGESLELGLYSFAIGGQRASGGYGYPTETAEGGVTMTSFIAGATLMLGGVAQQGFSINSASGTDWAVAAVPEPQTWMLMGLGLGGLLTVRRRAA